MKTIIYITNNVLDEKIDALCRKHILNSIGDNRLISVSQKPIDFGENICVGELAPSSLSIDLQMLEGLKRTETEFVAIAEHDCLYTPEHFEFTPPDDDFWYNENVWCLQYYSEDKPEVNGTFSTFPGRKANSQLIVSTKSLLNAINDRVKIMADPSWKRKHPTGRIGEAGAFDEKHARLLVRGESVKHLAEPLLEYARKYKGKNFRTKNPNVDIRHNSNFTKNRRGYKRRFEIPYWGRMEDLWI